jgi:DNA-binding HxlR family transcriptional regulator
MTANPIEHVALLTIFSSLVDGPRSVSDMPRSWPISRALLRMVVRRLERAGFVERASGPRGARLQLTALGWMRAAELARPSC